MKTELQDKVVLVTGGGTGIGKAVAHEFAAHGAKVVITGRRLSKLDEARAQSTAPGSIYARAADIAERSQVAELVQWTSNVVGEIDILVNNAGVNVTQRKLAQLSLDDWDYIMNVNSTGAFNLIHAILPSMRKRKSGLVITVSSLAGVRASPLGGAAYSASKHAVCALTRVIGQEEHVHGIRATNICPGEVNTPILDDRPIPVSDEHRRQILQPEDVAAAVLFVASLPARANVPELYIKPTTQMFV